ETGYGMILLNPGGGLQHITEQARRWLEVCFPKSETQGNALPKEIVDWLGTKAQSVRRPLLIEREAKRLVVRLADENAEQRLLLLTEEQPVFALERLEASGLTPRESEVLHWVAEGKTNPEIGIILDLSARTVQKHLEHIFQKLEVQSRTAALMVLMEK